MATYKQLTEQLAKIQVQVVAAREKEVVAAIERIKQLIAEYDISAEELGLHGERKASRKASHEAARKPAALPPKYRNPKTGQTWSGRGRAPEWLGKNRDRFLIES